MTNRKSIEKNVEGLVMPILKDLKIELVEVEYTRQRNQRFLRIYIDKVEGVNVDDCETVSKKLGDLLDDLDIIPHSYYLEVSSPGLDRPLKTDMQLNKHLGEKVEIGTYKAINGSSKHIGNLEKFDNDIIVITDENGKNVELDRKLISIIRLVIEF